MFCLFLPRHTCHLHLSPFRFSYTVCECVLCVWECVGQGESVGGQRIFAGVSFPWPWLSVSRDPTQIYKDLVVSIFAHFAISLAQCHPTSLWGKFMWMSGDHPVLSSFFYAWTNELHSIPRRTISKPVFLNAGGSNNPFRGVTYLVSCISDSYILIHNSSIH